MYPQLIYNFFRELVFKAPLPFYVMYTDDIKRILNSVKFDDTHIMLKKPMEIPKYGRIIKIQQINYFYKWDSFSKWLGVFLACYNNVCESFGLPETLDDCKKFRDNIKFTLKNIKSGKLAFKAALKLSSLSKLKTRWMKRKFDQDDWSEILTWIFVYNVFGVKKNLSNVLKLVKAVQSN
jgi:hypothetical protein